jgi:hypothetical protein
MRWIVVAALALAGCATATHYRNALHPSYTQADFDRDNYDCRRENQHQVVAIIGTIGQANDVVDDDMAAACMRGRGWRQVSDNAAAPRRPFVLGGGNQSCGLWTEDARSSPNNAAMLKHWVGGFLTGVDYVGQQPPLNGVQPESVFAWIDNYCQTHSADTIDIAAIAFVRAHPQ